MSQSFAAQLFLATLTGIGLWLGLQWVLGLLKPRDVEGQTQPAMQRGLGRSGQRELVVSALEWMPPLAQRLIAPTVIDLGFLLFGARSDPASVEDRLRRAGWPFVSVGDYYGSKIAYTVGFFCVGALCGVLFGLNPLGVASLAAGTGLMGLLNADRDIEALLTQRRESLRREMAWTIDRLATVMSTGRQLQPTLVRLTSDEYAWVAGGAGGLFIALLRDIVRELSAGRNDVAVMLDELRRSLPEGVPELDEFLKVVQLNLEKNKPAVAQFRALGKTMRDQLNNRIDELAQEAEKMNCQPNSRGALGYLRASAVGNSTAPWPARRSAWCSAFTRSI
jgi:hypothetical protein